MNLKNILWVRNTGKILPNAPIGDNLLGMKLSGGGGLITTAKGNPVSIVASKAQNAISTILSFSPKQSGSGTPSPQNIRPIEGWTEANLGVNSETPTITINLGGTYYGGTVDLENGTAEINYALVDLGTLGWIYQSYVPRFFSPSIVSVALPPTANNIPFTGKCEVYGTGIVPTSATSNLMIGMGITGNLFIKDTRFDNVEDFLAYVDGKYLAYEVRIPQTITLTPQTVALLKGNNTLWTDGDEVSVTYKAKK
jgi:hypothetical protein